MKKFFLINILLILFLCCEAQRSFRIVGDIQDLPDENLLLSVWDGEKNVVIAKTIASQGKFVFIGCVSESIWAVVHNSKGSLVAMFMLENAEYSISDSGVVTGGGEAQAIWRRFDALNRELSDKRKEMEVEYLQAEQAGNKKRMAEIDESFRVFLESVKEKETVLLKQYGDSRVAAYVVASTMQGLSYSQLQSRFDLLGGIAKDCSYGKVIADRILKLESLEIDAIAPNFSLPSSVGGEFSLYEAKGRLKLVYFWASYDAQSRTKNVELLKLYRQYYPKGLEIISVSLDVDNYGWLKAIGEDGISDWLNGCDLLAERSVVVQSYCIENIPCMLLLDEDNRIVEKNLWGDELHNRISELLKK